MKNRLIGSRILSLLAVTSLIFCAACRDKGSDADSAQQSGETAAKATQIAPAMTFPGKSGAQKVATTDPATPSPATPAQGAEVISPPPQEAESAVQPTTPTAPITAQPPQTAEQQAIPPQQSTPGPSAGAAAPSVVKIDESAKVQVLPNQEGVKSLPAPNLLIQSDASSADQEKKESAKQAPFEATLVMANTNIDVILDASGSMGALQNTGTRTKFDALRDGLFSVVMEMGQQQSDFPRNIGVRLFGAKSPSSANDCTDTESVANMGAPNLGGLRSVLDPITPKGTSPISKVILDAVNDFPAGDTADRLIVLVADGSDTCNSDPCEAAAKLDKTAVHVIGYDLNPTDQPKLECIAQKTGGKYYSARNEDELRLALAEAINATVPYNIKITALAQTTAIPFDLTIYKAGMTEVIKKDTSVGTKLVRLAPGAYDILIEYTESPEDRKPSMIKQNIDVLESTRKELNVPFELGELNISSVNSDGVVVPARYSIMQEGNPQPIGNMKTGETQKSFYLTPGTYSITATLLEGGTEEFEITQNNIVIKGDVPAQQQFKFQKGQVQLKGVTTQKESIPFVFQAYKAGKSDAAIASGAFAADGGTFALTPGIYDIVVVGNDPKKVANPATKIKDVEIKAGELKDLIATLEMGILKLSAVDGQENKLPAEFVIKIKGADTVIAKTSTKDSEAAQIELPPGEYDIVATSMKSPIEPRPSVTAPGVKVLTDKPTEKQIKFVLGTLRLRGRSAKEVPISTEFTIYRSGTSEVANKAPASSEWVVFDLPPGLYDVSAKGIASDNTTIWLRNLTIADGTNISHEAIFTAGKIKIIGRGPNSQIITCTFKIYKYGADREIINGVTGDDWKIYEIDPGDYYLEAGYHDEEQSVLLKKWINISIGENEIVEEVLRF